MITPSKIAKKAVAQPIPNTEYSFPDQVRDNEGKNYTFKEPKFNEIQIKFGKLPNYEKLSEVLYINETPKKTDNEKILYFKDLKTKKYQSLLKSICNLIDAKDKYELLHICRKEKVFFD